MTDCTRPGARSEDGPGVARGGAYHRIPVTQLRFHVNKCQALRLFCTEPYRHDWVHHQVLHILEDAVQHASILGLISKALRDNYDRVADEPLPERWVELIHYLNERERAEADRRRQHSPPTQAPNH